MSTAAWAWAFTAVYVLAMLVLGVVAARRVRAADDFATARGSYGPVVLALAFAATTASGATFLGGPGLAYRYGTASLWSSLLYPLAVFTGVLVSARGIAASGARFGSRSIPELLGDRYGSDAIRLVVALFSLLLTFYIAGQLVAALVLFHTLLGLSWGWALAITCIVLAFYVVMGGAHADILSDAVQGVMMLLLAALVVGMFLAGGGPERAVDGGWQGVVAALRQQDAQLVGWLNPTTPLYHSWWSVVAIFLAHLPMGLLPHLGNKVWALRAPRQRRAFVALVGAFGLILGLLLLGGLVARGLLGDALLREDGANDALPRLFLATLPPWLAALIGVGVLAAVMSTADGLVVAASQVIANDIYRRSWLGRRAAGVDPAELDRRVLRVGRWASIAVVAVCAALAVALRSRNIALLIWIGLGGLMAALAGPLVLGAVWRGVTKAGAVAGLVTGLTVFVVLHAQLLQPAWLAPGAGREVLGWLHAEGVNPMSCTALAEIASVLVTVVVSACARRALRTG